MSSASLSFTPTGSSSILMRRTRLSPCFASIMPLAGEFVLKTSRLRSDFLSCYERTVPDNWTPGPSLQT